MKKSSAHSETIRKTVNLENMMLDYVVEYRNVKNPRMEISPDSLFLILPRHVKNEIELLEKKHAWIKKKYDVINEILKTGSGLSGKFFIFGEHFNARVNPEITGFKLDYGSRELEIPTCNFRKLKKHLASTLKDRIHSMAGEYADRFGVKFNKILIRSQRTKWASCSSKGNLSFNIKLISLDENVIKYVVLHEILHLIERNHGRKFHNLFEENCKNIEEMEKELFRQWFILNRNKFWSMILS